MPRMAWLDQRHPCIACRLRQVFEALVKPVPAVAWLVVPEENRLNPFPHQHHKRVSQRRTFSLVVVCAAVWIEYQLGASRQLSV
jgi:hypothetical protein